MNTPPDAPRVEQDVEAMLLHAAYDRLPLSLQMTVAVTFIFAGLLWSFFPKARMMAWVLAILVVVAVRYLLWASFKRAEPESDALARWRRLFLVGSTAAGAAWALGPILMMPQAGSPASALFVGTLLSVCAVAISTQGSQQTAMQAFVITALVPSAIAIWGTGGDVERVTAVVLMAGLVSLIVVGRRSSKAMRELLETQSRIRAILNTAMDAVIGMDAQGQITDWNLRAETIFGWSKDEALGLTFHDTIFPEQNQEAHRQGLTRSLATGEDRFLNRRIETTAMRRNGEEFPIELAITQLRTGETWHFTAFIEDITERKQSEKALERTRMGLRQIIDLIPEMLWLKDVDGRFLMVNQANARNYNMSVDALTGRLHSEIHSDKDELAKMLLDDRRVIETGVPIFIPEESFLGADGLTRYLQTSKIPFDFAETGKTAILGIALDITQRKEHEKELLKIEKLESLGVLAGGIAHDFNNILTGIMGNISFALMFLDPTHKSYKRLTEAEKASVRARELAQQLLTFARGGEPVKRIVSINQLIRESVSLVLSGTNVRGVFDVPDSLHTVEADEGQISQVFRNIIINATHAMPGGGTLTVIARNEKLAIKNTLALPAGMYARISFTDNGCGISADDLQKIFDPYFTTKSTGNGLGLASVHSIISRHRGNINATSVVGKGTTFTIYLPSTGETGTGYQADSPKHDAGAHRGGSILVMDDEEIIRELASEMLEYLGYQVKTCEEGTEAVALYKAARQAGKPFAAVIMDLTIPAGMGGKEAAQQIRAIDPTACLIVSSGYSNDPIMADFTIYGFSAAVAKPYSMAEFSRLLGSL